jgi:hypothetical protein
VNRGEEYEQGSFSQMLFGVIDENITEAPLLTKSFPAFVRYVGNVWTVTFSPLKVDEQV